MIELTPLDVRKKRGDFAKVLRGYDPQEVDIFLELLAERVEGLLRENLRLRERTERLAEQVAAQESREHAVQEALVTVQELGRQVREQTEREGKMLEREAQERITRTLHEAERLLDERRTALEELERRRIRFLRAFRVLLERELDVVEVETHRTPPGGVTLDMKVVRRRWAAGHDEADNETPDVASEPEGGRGKVGEEVPDTSVPGTKASPHADSDGTAEVEGYGAAEKEVHAPESDSEESLWLSPMLRRDQPRRE